MSPTGEHVHVGGFVRTACEVTAVVELLVVVGFDVRDGIEVQAGIGFLHSNKHGVVNAQQTAAFTAVTPHLILHVLGNDGVAQSRTHRQRHCTQRRGDDCCQL